MTLLVNTFHSEGPFDSSGLLAVKAGLKAGFRDLEMLILNAIKKLNRLLRMRISKRYEMCIAI